MKIEEDLVPACWNNLDYSVYSGGQHLRNQYTVCTLRMTRREWEEKSRWQSSRCQMDVDEEEPPLFEDIYELGEALGK